MKIFIDIKKKSVNLKGIKATEVEKTLDYLTNNIDEFKIFENGKKINIFTLEGFEGFTSTITK